MYFFKQSSSANLQKKSGYPLFRHFWKIQCHCTMDCMGLQGLDGIFVGFYKNFCGVRKKASPFRGGGSAERRDGEVAADLRRPLSHLR